MAFGVDRIVQGFLGEQKQRSFPAFGPGSFTFAGTKIKPNVNVTDWHMEGGFTKWFEWTDTMLAGGTPLFENAFNMLVWVGIQFALEPAIQAKATFTSGDATDLLKDVVDASLKDLVTLKDRSFDYAVQGIATPVKATSTLGILNAVAVDETLRVNASMNTTVAKETNTVPMVPKGTIAEFTNLPAGSQVDGTIAPDLITTFLTKLARGGIFDTSVSVTGASGTLRAQAIKSAFDAKQGRGLTHTSVSLKGTIIAGGTTKEINATVRADVQVDEECEPGLDLSFVGVEATALSRTGNVSTDLALRKELTRQLGITLSSAKTKAWLNGGRYRSVPLLAPNLSAIPNAQVWASSVRNTASAMTIGLRIGDQPSRSDRCLGTLARAVRSMLQINQLVSSSIGLTDPSPILIKGLQTRFTDLISRGAFNITSTSDVLGAVANFGFASNGAATVRALAAQSTDSLSTLEVRIPMTLSSQVQIPFFGATNYTGLLADYVIRLDAVRSAAGELTDLRTRDALVDNVRLPGVPANLTAPFATGTISAFTSGMAGRLFPR